MTIIVLLILAGITIATLTRDNGILTKAQEAKTRTEEEEKNEKKDLAIIEETMEGKGTEIEEVKDKNPGALEIEDSIYVINSIEDLVAFASDVNNGNTYEGKTVKLGLNLDFNSSKSYVNPFRKDYEKYGYSGELKKLLTSGEGFISIGTNANESDYTEKNFKGTFDGNEKIIKNIYINRKVEDNQNDFVVGLFGYNYGTIKKLGLENCNISGNLTTSGQNTCMIGGITGRNCKDIEECFVSGNVSSACNAKSRCGGICATSDGSTNIINCYNLATINCTGGSQVNVSGGIAGSTAGRVANCFNNGKIFMTCNGEKAHCNVGGLIGTGNIGNTEVENCYNLSNIILDIDYSDLIACGGIVGNQPGGDLNNCYNKGNINELSLNCRVAYIGLILGLATNCTASNCSSLSFNAYKATEGIGTGADVKELTLCDDEANMPNILEIIGEKFENGPDGYPILSWQK